MLYQKSNSSTPTTRTAASKILEQRKFELSHHHHGFNQFRKDFGVDSEEVFVGGGGRPSLLPPIGTKRDFLRETPTFDVDERYLEDGREIINFMRPGEKEYKLFDDHFKYDLMRSVYNVNFMNCCNPKEICSRKVPQKSVQCWPVDVLGNDVNEWKKSVNKFIGYWLTADDGFGGGGGHLNRRADNSQQLNHSNASSVDSAFSEEVVEDEVSAASNDEEVGIGAFGLQSLARCFYDDEGIYENPMGYVSFVGMNLQKVFKDIDKTEPILPTFAGPLAEHNHTLDYGSVEVLRSFEEYNMPWQPGWTWQEADEWRKKIRMKQPLMKLFSFHTLMYIFYTIPMDNLQLMAIRELHKRGWRYHKIFQVWMTPNPRCGVMVVGEEDSSTVWQTGIYIYFNYLKWDLFKAEFKISPGVLTSDAETSVWVEQAIHYNPSSLAAAATAEVR